jgi:hypothetical protein
MNPPVLVRRHRARAEEIGGVRHDAHAHAHAREQRAGGGTRIRMAFVAS